MTGDIYYEMTADGVVNVYADKTLWFRIYGCSEFTVDEIEATITEMVGMLRKEESTLIS